MFRLSDRGKHRRARSGGGAEAAGWVYGRTCGHGTDPTTRPQVHSGSHTHGLGLPATPPPALSTRPPGHTRMPPSSQVLSTHPSPVGARVCWWGRAESQQRERSETPQREDPGLACISWALALMGKLSTAAEVREAMTTRSTSSPAGTGSLHLPKLRQEQTCAHDQTHTISTHQPHGDGWMNSKV
jgi:hypothetical protein